MQVVVIAFISTRDNEIIQEEAKNLADLVRQCQRGQLEL